METLSASCVAPAGISRHLFPLHMWLGESLGNTPASSKYGVGGARLSGTTSLHQSPGENACKVLLDVF